MTTRLGSCRLVSNLGRMVQYLRQNSSVHSPGPELEIVRSFEHRETLSASDIVRLTGLSRSTVYRSLSILVRSDFLSRDQTRRRYLLGPRILQLGMLARRRLAADTVVGPHLLKLHQQTRETVTFSIVDGSHRLCVQVLEAESELRQVAQAGTRYPLHLGAAGKVIIAHMDRAVASLVLQNQGVLPGEVHQAFRALDKIRRQGYAVTVGERVPGVCAAAAPVFLQGVVYGSVAVAGPRDRMRKALGSIIPLVVGAARMLPLEILSSTAETTTTKKPGDGAR